MKRKNLQKLKRLLVIVLLCTILVGLIPSGMAVQANSPDTEMQSTEMQMGDEDKQKPNTVDAGTFESTVQEEKTEAKEEKESTEKEEVTEEKNTTEQKVTTEEKSTTEQKSTAVKKEKKVTTEKEAVATFGLNDPMTVGTEAEDFVGFTKKDYYMNSSDYAEIDSGVGVNQFYLTEKSTYTTPSSSRAQKDLIGKSQIAYSYNYYKSEPNGNTTYSESVGNDSAKYTELAGRNKKLKDEALYNKICSIVMNGYGNNKAGIKAAYNLNDEQFRALTQYALWYYTDGVELKFIEKEGDKYFYVTDHTGKSLYVSGGRDVFYPYDNPQLEAAYNALRDSNRTLTATEKNKVALHQNTGSASAYMNLLAVAPGEKTATFNLLHFTTGNDADKNKAFKFKLEFSDENGSPLANKKYDVVSIYNPNGEKLQMTTISFDANGVANVDLKDGQGFIIEDLPVGYKYKVTESDNAGYTQLIKGDSPENKTGVSDTASLVFIDHKGDTTGTTGKAQLKLTNNTTGKLGDLDKEFTFKVRLWKNASKGRLDNIAIHYESTAIGGVAPADVTNLPYTREGTAVVFTVKLKHGQTIEFTTLPEGFTYEIEEVEANKDNYTTKVTTGSAENKTGVANKAEVVFTNQKGEDGDPPAKDTVSLKVTKTVTGVKGDRDKEFTFQVRFRDPNTFAPLNAQYVFEATSIDGVEVMDPGTVRYDSEKADFVFKIKHGQSLEFRGIPKGTYYFVNEVEANQDGYVTTYPYDAQNGYINKKLNVEVLNDKMQTQAIESGKVTTHLLAYKQVKNGSSTYTPTADSFSFVLKEGSNQVATVKNNDTGTIIFTKEFDKAGTYSYTMEEVQRNDSDMKYDTSAKKVKVVVSNHDLLPYNEQLIYFGREGENGEYRLDPDYSQSRISVFGTRDGLAGPKTIATTTSAKQMYQAVIDPSVIQEGTMIEKNIYGTLLEVNLKKLFSYLDSDEASQFSTKEKQLLVSAVTGNQVGNWTKANTTINGNKMNTNSVYTVLDKIYETEKNIDNMSLVFYLPYGDQKTSSPKPLITGYGANVTYETDQVFTNTKIQPDGNYKVQIVATKTIKNGDSIEKPKAGQFTFVLKDWLRREIQRTTNDENGKVVFNVAHDSAGSYGYYVAEVDDGQPGYTYDTTDKKVTVNISSEGLTTKSGIKLKPNTTYYAYSNNSSNPKENGVIYFDSNTNFANKTVAYCSYFGVPGPQWTSNVPASQQTYNAVINPETLTPGTYVKSNRYGSSDTLKENLRKLLYYLETADHLHPNGKMALVWSATGNTAHDYWMNSSYVVNNAAIKIGNETISNTNTDTTKILGAIYRNVTVPDNYELAFLLPADAWKNTTIPSGKDKGKKPIQPLVVGGFTSEGVNVNEVNVQNTKTTPKTVDLKLQKKVTGYVNPKDPLKLFSFEISLTDSGNKAINGTYSGINFVNGKATVRLAHDQNLVIKGLPAGVKYTIKELDADQYVTSINGTKSDNKTTSGAINDGMTTVEYVNESPDKEEDVYSIKVNKINEAGEALEEAGFRLYTDKACTKLAEAYLDAGLKKPLKDANENDLLTNTHGILQFFGLKAGTYYLKEFTAPNGYKLLDQPLKIQIDQNGTVTVDGDAATVVNGVIEIDIVNEKDFISIILPESGSIGELMLRLIGFAAIVIGFLFMAMSTLTRKKVLLKNRNKK